MSFDDDLFIESWQKQSGGASPLHVRVRDISYTVAEHKHFLNKPVAVADMREAGQLVFSYSNAMRYHQLKSVRATSAIRQLTIDRLRDYIRQQPPILTSADA